MKEFSFSKAEFGMIATAGFWTYALSVIFNGPLADRIGGKKAIIFGAIGASAINLLIGLLFLNGWQTKIIVGMSLLYAVNQYFQSFGALSVVKVNAPWFHVKERGMIGGIFGTLISLGYLFAFSIGSLIMSHLGWKWVFIIPAFAIATMAVVDFFLVKDKPEEAGYPKINTDDATSHLADDVKINFSYIVKQLFSNPVIVTLIAAEFCTGFVRQGLLLWFVPFLQEVHGIKHGSHLFDVASLGITVGGVAGALLGGFLSDKVFQSRRPPVAFIFYIGQIFALIMLGLTKNPTIAASLIGFACMWIFGVHGMLTGAASMDFGGSKATSTVAGLFDGIQYLAAGLTGFALGHYLDKFGWGAWVYMIIPFSVIGGILMLTLWNQTPQKNREYMKAKGK